jgi:serine protease
MPSKTVRIFLAGLLFCLMQAAQAALLVNPPNASGGEGLAAGILIKMRDSTTPLAIAQAGGQPRLTVQTVSQLQVVAATPLHYQRTMSFGAHVLKFDQPKPVAEAKDIVARLMTMTNVEFATPNLIIHPQLDPSDTLYTNGSQWYLNDPPAGANLPPAWDFTTGSKAINIAVIDTGYTEHSDLDYSQFASDGYDFISDDIESGDSTPGRDSDARDEGDFCTSAGTDSSWHGTAVMSLIGAITDNNSLMAGINWNATMIPVRVLGRCGGTEGDLIDAIRWAAGLHVAGTSKDNAHPARVINMSLGGTGSCDGLLQSAIDDAHNAGAVIVAAAGNSSLPVSSTAPANCNNVMAIAAHDQAGDIGVFSNYGAGIDLSAPGVGIVVATCASTTTYNCKDSTLVSNPPVDGTSVAAPMVSGVASLLLSEKPGLNNYYVESMLRNSARPFVANSTCIGQCGSGMLDAGAALMLARNFVSPASQVEISKDSGGAVLPAFWIGVLLVGWFWRRLHPRAGAD